jgi:hypothetical protein
MKENSFLIYMWRHLWNARVALEGADTTSYRENRQWTPHKLLLRLSAHRAKGEKNKEMSLQLCPQAADRQNSCFQRPRKRVWQSRLRCTQLASFKIAAKTKVTQRWNETGRHLHTLTHYSVLKGLRTNKSTTAAAVFSEIAFAPASRI